MAFALFSAGMVKADVTIDGSASGAEGYTTQAVQTQALATVYSDWDARNALANFRSVPEGNTLNVFLGGVVNGSGRSFLLFIDSKPGGISQIGIDQITYLEEGSGDDENYINSMTGMTFENGFLPDHVIRIGGGGTGTNRRAYVNRYDLVAGTFVVCGEAHQANLSNGFITNMKAEWNGVSGVASYAAFPYGVEMALNLPDLGVTGATNVKMMAILVDGIAYEGSNHVLAPLPEGADPIGFDFSTIDFEAIPGTQTISIPVAGTGLDPMQDQDGDGLLNGVETSTGTFVDASNTGTNPNDNDSDDDGYPDGQEVNGTSALGYISNPTNRNYPNMAVPGSFNLPVAWQANSALNSPATAMTQASTSLTGQYLWSLDYKFAASQTGSLAYKFTTGGNFNTQWGSGITDGVAIPNGNDFAGSVAASGIHRFSFDQISLAHSLSRTVFADQMAFLTAYGLEAGVDTDGDGILNEAEFVKNTDPTNPDSDGDGLKDTEEQPLIHTTFPEGYANWISSFATDKTSMESDPDADGFSNRVEFYFGTSPVVNQGTLVKSELSGGSLVLRWVQVSGGVSYTLEQNANLSNASGWETSATVPATDPDQSGVTAGFVRKKAALPATSGKLFLRVKASN